jgi:hypothetical protein
VVGIYREVKELYNIVGLVLVILAEDEMKVKSRVAWDATADNFIGFFGVKDNHHCVTNFKPVVGIGYSGYNNILEAFSSYRIAGFARVIIVNPLHEKLPKLTLAVYCTCNCFDSNWI